MRLTVDGRYLIYRKTCGTMTDELMVQTHKQAFAQIVKSSPILSSHVLPIIPRRTGGKCIATATTLASGLPAKLAGYPLNCCRGGRRVLHVDWRLCNGRRRLRFRKGQARSSQALSMPDPQEKQLQTLTHLILNRHHQNVGPWKRLYRAYNRNEAEQLIARPMTRLDERRMN